MTNVNKARELRKARAIAVREAEEESAWEKAVETFESFGFKETTMVQHIIIALNSDDGMGSKITIDGKNIILNNKLELRYKKGKRFPSLENAIKAYEKI